MLTLCCFRVNIIVPYGISYNNNNEGEFVYEKTMLCVLLSVIDKSYVFIHKLFIKLLILIGL